MNNNDPIKEYNPVSLKLDRLQEKLEMSISKDEAVTDLHDCSNDLSDAGSRKEEIAHSEFSNKIRQNLNKYDDTRYKSKDVWENVPKNVDKSKVGIIVLVCIIIWIIGFIFTIVTQVFSSIGDFIESVIESQTTYIEEKLPEEDNQEISEEEFKHYVENVLIDMHTTVDDKTIMVLKNANNRSISNVYIELVFFDENNNMIKICDAYIGGIIGTNTQFYELYDAPADYSRFQYNIVPNYNTSYSDLTLENIILTTNGSYENYSDLEISLQNNTDEDLDTVEIVVAYFKEGKIIDVSSYYIFDLKSGKQESKNLYLYQYNEYDNISININEVNIY